jgi:hypothetical protein
MSTYLNDTHHSKFYIFLGNTQLIGTAGVALALFMASLVPDAQALATLNVVRKIL